MAKTHFNCPHCGGQIYVAPQQKQLTARRPNSHLLASDTRSIFSGRQSQSLRSDTATIPAGDYRKTTPVSRVETGDITTALYDAGASFVITTIGATGLMYAASLDGWYIVGPTVGFLVGAGRYFGAVNFAKSLTRIVEKFTSDVSEPDPTPKPKPDPWEVIHKNERGTIQSIQRFRNLPQNVLDNLPHFAQQAAIKGLSENQWTGKSGLFSKSEYSQLMATLHEAGIVVWVNPKAKAQGREITRSGGRALADMAKNGQK